MFMFFGSGNTIGAAAISVADGLYLPLGFWFDLSIGARFRSVFLFIFWPHWCWLHNTACNSRKNMSTFLFCSCTVFTSKLLSKSRRFRHNVIHQGSDFPTLEKTIDSAFCWTLFSFLSHFILQLHIFFVLFLRPDFPDGVGFGTFDMQSRFFIICALFLRAPFSSFILQRGKKIELSHYFTHPPSPIRSDLASFELPSESLSLPITTTHIGFRQRQEREKQGNTMIPCCLLSPFVTYFLSPAKWFCHKVWRFWDCSIGVDTIRWGYESFGNYFEIGS